MALKPHILVGFIAVVLLIYAAFAFDLPYREKIDDFETCAAAGNPIMESYPRQCRDKKGNLFVEEVVIAVPPTYPDANGGISPASTTPSASSTGAVLQACRPTGCSSQICSDEDVMSTCEYRPEYACYKSAVCERQASGQCGWTETPALKACLINPPQTE